MRRLKAFSAIAILVAAILVPLVPDKTYAYSQTRMIDNIIFDNVNTFNEAQIQAFLVSKGSCLASYNDVDPTWNGSAWTYGGSVSAAHTIWKVSQGWGINPQVILATLQKEQSLISSGLPCVAPRIISAMGYDCPDSGGRYDYPALGVTQTCVAHEKNAGFARQVLWAAWQLKFSRERSEGNVSWNGDGNITYVGYMTQGSFKRCNACSLITYDGNATIDGQSLHLENGATAALYAYTPHLGQSFPGIFQNWFGSPTTGASLSTPLFRLYKRSTDRHFYTSGAAERDSAMRNGYALEGTSFYVSTSGGGNLAPVYRLYSRSSDYHFYTNNYDEANRATGIGFVLEGIGYYASNGGDPGVQPVYRLLNRGNGKHFFTSSAGERDQAVRNGSHSYEGIAFFAVPN